VLARLLRSEHVDLLRESGDPLEYLLLGLHHGVEFLVKNVEPPQKFSMPHFGRIGASAEESSYRAERSQRVATREARHY
jgi:hypothetical protein